MGAPKTHGKLWSRSELKAMQEEYSKWLAKQPEGGRVKLRELARHIHDTTFPSRTYLAIEAALQRNRIWKPLYARGTTSENKSGSPHHIGLRKKNMVKAHRCPKCGHLTEVE